jgi:phosphatidylserine/phosphatidylglycerophosphate/cardiolipin synthase-like enzyme
MHNKFAVFDAHHTNPAKTRLITSSWNATDEGTFDQYQNMVIVQDVALARAYWYEFNQMWGAESGSFNPSTAKFGPFKSVVNPTVFWIGEDNVKVEAYFSPQANTEAKIIRALSTAEANIDLTLNLITRRTISTAMLNRFNEGVEVRGSIAVVTGDGAEFDYLSTWADVHHFSQAEYGLLHHKYAIVDGELTSTNSKVITGSHNWSANANFNNDENILIIKSARVANEYFQEFAARYWEAGGEDEFDVTVSIDDLNPEIVDREILLQNYPNPFNETTAIQFDLESNQNVSLNVYDILGRNVITLIEDKPFPRGLNTVSLDASSLAGGLYIYRLQLEGGRDFSKSMFIFK